MDCEKPHCSLSQPPQRDLPPALSGVHLCLQTFTHLLLTLELFRANKPLKEEEMLPGSLCEYFKIYKFVLIGTLRWLAYTVDLSQREEGGRGIHQKMLNNHNLKV